MNSTTLYSSIVELIQRLSIKEFASRIDHTMIKPNIVLEDIVKVIEDTKDIGFACYVVSPSHALEILQTYSDVPICSVIGFPMGYTPHRVKVLEAKMLVDAGIREIDVVMNIQKFKEKRYEYVVQELKEIVDLAHSVGVHVKVIIETCLLNDEEKKKACELVIESGADYVKTSTGFMGCTTTLHDVSLLRDVCRDRIKIKASGGIRHAVDALMMLVFGADRIGTSSGVSIVREFKELKSRFK